MFLPPGVAQLQEVHRPGATAAPHRTLPGAARLHPAGGAIQQDRQRVENTTQKKQPSSAVETFERELVPQLGKGSQEGATLVFLSFFHHFLVFQHSFFV